MASSTSSLVLLFLLVGVGACVVEGISGQTTNVGSTNTADREGDDLLARVMMPSILMDHVSPLGTKAASSYAAKIEDGSITQHAKDFCTEAKLLCDANVNILDPSMDISLKNLLEGGNLLERAKAMVEASKAMFFSPKALEVGKDITMPTTLHDQYPTTSFLPQSLANLMPLSGDKIAELLQKLNIPPESNLAIMMSRTSAHCEAKAKPTEMPTPTKESSRICATSMEDMAKFVADRFPQDARIYALERTIPAFTASQDSGAQNCDLPNPECITGTDCTHPTSVPALECESGSNIGDGAPLSAKTGTAVFKVLEAKEYEHTVVCHKNMFPFAVYECHNMDSHENENVEDNMKIYAVAMESHEGGHRINQIASCRGDIVGAEKSTRKALIPNPLVNEAAACHWLSDAFVWAQAPAAERKP